MTDRDAMAFTLTVTAGADEGKTFPVAGGECVVGRAPTSTIVLSDESVAWEHALLRSVDGAIRLQNLAATGTRLKGRPVTGEVKLAMNQEIELSDSCRIVVSQQAGAAARAKVRPALIALVAVLLLLGAGGAWVAMRDTTPPPPPFTHRHYENAYLSLEARLGLWASQGWPGYEETLVIFRNAWRLERAFNPEAAVAEWNHLRSLLLTLRRPGQERTVAQTTEADARKALGVVAEWDPITSTSTEPYYDSDEAYADALARFVRRRAEITQQQVEDRR